VQALPTCSDGFKPGEEGIDWEGRASPARKKNQQKKPF